MKNYLFILLLLAPVIVLSQDIKTAKDFTINTGKPYQVVDAGIKEYFYNNGEVLSIKIHGNITIQKFDATSLNELSRSEIIAKKDLPRGFVHEEFVQKGSKIYQFFNVWDKPKLTEQIFVQEIDFEDHLPKNKRLLFTVNGKMISAVGQDKIDVYMSFDATKFLIIYRRKPTEKRDKYNYDKIGMMVYDQSMNPIWQKEIKMPYTEADMDNLGYTVDSKGNAYVLARVRKDHDSRLEVLKYSVENEQAEITIVKAEGRKFPRGITMQEGKEGKIYCAGFYGDGSSANGIYVSILTTNGAIENEQFHDIPLEIINKNISDRKQEKNERKEEKGNEVGIYKLGLDQIRIKPDGSLILVGEVFYVTTRTVYNSQTHTTKVIYQYHYKEMLITKISETGEMLWVNKLVKYQYREDSGGAGFSPFGGLFFSRRKDYDLSYRYMNTNFDHYLLYLDNVKNLNLPDNKYPAKHVSGRGGYFTAYKINDATGEVSKLSLFDMRNVNGIPVYQFSIDRIVQSGDDVMLLELYKKKKEDILLKISIEE